MLLFSQYVNLANISPSCKANLFFNLGIRSSQKAPDGKCALKLDAHYLELDGTPTAAGIFAISIRETSDSSSYRTKGPYSVYSKWLNLIQFPSRIGPLKVCVRNAIFHFIDEAEKPPKLFIYILQSGTSYHISVLTCGPCAFIKLLYILVTLYLTYFLY